MLDQLDTLLPDLSKPYPFEIGSTGYVELHAVPKSSQLYGKAVDSQGRKVYLIGQYLVFQRYTSLSRYMYTKMGDTSYSYVSSELVDQLIEMAKNKPVTQSPTSVTWLHVE